jgi:hypothetical protein
VRWFWDKFLFWGWFCWHIFSYVPKKQTLLLSIVLTRLFRATLFMKLELERHPVTLRKSPKLCLCRNGFIVVEMADVSKSSSALSNAFHQLFWGNFSRRSTLPHSFYGNTHGNFVLSSHFVSCTISSQITSSVIFSFVLGSKPVPIDLTEWFI